MGKLDNLMFIVSVCEAFGWTYQQYQEQPAFFLELIREKMMRDNKERDREVKKMKRG